VFSHQQTILLFLLSHTISEEHKDAVRQLYSRPTPRRELHQQHSGLWTTPNVPVTSRELLRTSFTTPDVELHLPKLFSETSTDTRTVLSISSLLKECTLANLSTQDLKPLSLLVMCYPSAKCQKALLSPILRQSKEIVEVLLALQDVPLL
jgi:hypothetical protein